MPNLRRSKDAAAPGRCKSTVGCKKHPKHRQSPGVCSLCLREKLSQLSTSSTRSIGKTKMESSCSSSSLSSDYSSSSASSCSSPVYRYHSYGRYPSGKGSLSFFWIGSGNNRLAKSRTIAFVPRMRGKEGDERMTRGGVLSKLFRPIKRKQEGLVHSLVLRRAFIGTWEDF